MARTVATNFTGSLAFPYATAATDLFHKEDIQTLALAVDQHIHTPGSGMPIRNASVQPTVALLNVATSSSAAVILPGASVTMTTGHGGPVLSMMTIPFNSVGGTNVSFFARIDTGVWLQLGFITMTVASQQALFSSFMLWSAPTAHVSHTWDIGWASSGGSQIQTFNGAYSQHVVWEVNP